MESAGDDRPEEIERKARIERLKRDLFGDLLTTAEVAEILEVHPRTVGEYIRDGKLHAIQLGGSYRVSEDSLKSFVTGLYLEGSTLGSPASATFGGEAARRAEEEAVKGYEAVVGARSTEGRRARRGSGGGSMFERFTDRARRVVVLAQEEARQLQHGYIGTEHLLLGLISEGEGVAFQALEQMGISLSSSRQLIEDMIGTGSGGVTGHIPFTPRSKKVLELTLREALQLGHNYIGTEHILLGLLREGEGVGPQVLAKQGVDLAALRSLVIEILNVQLSQTVGTYVLPVTEERKPETQGPEAQRGKSGISQGNVVAASALNLEEMYEQIQRIEEGSGSKRRKKGKSLAASMYARFTQEARHVILYSQEEARLLNHEYVGSEHLLLGLLAGAEGGGVALRALNILGVAPEQTRVAVKMMIGTGSGQFVGQVPFTPRAKKVLELALREALLMGQENIGAEHLLLALVAEGEGVSAQVLKGIGLQLETARTVVREILTAGSHLEERLRSDPDPAKGDASLQKPSRAKKPKSKAKPGKSRTTTSKQGKRKPSPVKRKAKVQGAKPKARPVPSKAKPASRKKRQS